MLHTQSSPPSPPLSTQPASSSVENNQLTLVQSSSSSSVVQTPSEFDIKSIPSRPRAVSTSYNATLITNGPQNNRFLSTSQSRFSQLPDQDWFYSPTSSTSSRPSVHHLTPTPTRISETKSSTNLASPTNRRESCPVPRHNQKKEHRFRFPSIITSTIRDALMTNPSTTNSNIYTNDMARLASRTSISGCKRPTSIFLPVANPVAAAALVEDEETETIDDLPQKSITPSPLDTPKSSSRMHRTSTDGSVSLTTSHSYQNKAILNVGGVRHEGILFIIQLN